MAIEITERMFRQLGKYLAQYQNEWCDIIIELTNNEFLLFYGEIFSNEDNISFKGVKDIELILSFDKVLNKPSFELIEEFQTCKTNLFKNLNIVLKFSGKKISNQWEPPREVKFSGNPNIDFPTIKELDLENIIDDIFANKGKNIQLDITYFDLDARKLKSFIEGFEKGIPEIKRISIQGKIVLNDSIYGFIETINNEKLTLFYLQSLQVPVLMGLNFNNEIRLSELKYTID